MVKNIFTLYTSTILKDNEYHNYSNLKLLRLGKIVVTDKRVIIFFYICAIFLTDNNIEVQNNIKVKDTRKLMQCEHGI